MLTLVRPVILCLTWPHVELSDRAQTPLETSVSLQLLDFEHPEGKGSTGRLLPSPDIHLTSRETRLLALVVPCSHLTQHV